MEASKLKQQEIAHFKRVVCLRDDGKKVLDMTLSWAVFVDIFIGGGNVWQGFWCCSYRVSIVMPLQAFVLGMYSKNFVFFLPYEYYDASPSVFWGFLRLIGCVYRGDEYYCINLSKLLVVMMSIIMSTSPASRHKKEMQGCTRKCKAKMDRIFLREVESELRGEKEEEGEDREEGQSFWFFHVVKELNNENRWRVPDRIDRIINGSSRRDLLLNSQNFFRSTPAGAENPSLSRLCYRRLWGSRNRRALILGWVYYLDAFSSYPLRTWLPSVYRGHDNWHTRGKGPLNALTPTPDMDRTVSRRSEPSSRTALMGEQPNPWNILQPQVAKSRHRGAKPSRRYMSISPSLSPRQCPDRYAFRAGRNLPDKEFRYLRTVIVTAAVHRGFGRRLPCHQVTNFLDLPALGRRILYLPTCVGFGYRYPFVEGRSSFSWEYGMDYFSAVAPASSVPRDQQRALTHPPWTNLAEEPLGFRGIGFSPTFALLKPTFSLPLRPPLLAQMSSQLLRLNAFRGEPASSGFEWHFTPNHNSSADSSTSVGSDLHLVSPKLHPGVFSLARWSLLIHTGFHVPHATRMFQFTRLSLACPWIQQQFERLTYIGNPRIYAYFQLPEAFRRLPRPSSSLVHELEISGLEPLTLVNTVRIEVLNYNTAVLNSVRPY
uniref:Uncharacterized protein ORF91 n=1 Tax=Cajanus cajan TaxID=3821 RepID=A0A151RNA8_CAJCA|nr:Uncharacterized protein ORF91 [Cajanus cajan]